MPAELFDTHCHLTFKELLPESDSVITTAASVGVTRILTVACHAEEIAAAEALAERHPGIRLAGGVHPHEARSADDEVLSRWAAFWRTAGVVAAGEMGLDYHYDFSPRAVQQEVFQCQLDLAREADLPVIVHCREAHADVVRILAEQGYVDRAVVFHCFSGSLAEARELWANGWWTSFTGVITFKNADASRQVCAQAPADRLMFETDAPYLSPEPMRKVRPNTPALMIHTVRLAAVLRGCTFDELAENSTTNALGFFRIR
ncbi:MAG: TatD family hydrolase [Phycisphaerales bacterium]|nr:TatD family hydrolase [Phycisphaerales bacterium]